MYTERQKKHLQIWISSKVVLIYGFNPLIAEK